MYHAADHTMSNVMASVGLWEEEFVRLDAIRQKKRITNSAWKTMQVAARVAKLPFLKALAAALESKL